MSKLTVNAPAKINLTFEIVGQLDNGYHEVQTLLQSIDLQDKLHFEIQEYLYHQISLKTQGHHQDFPLNDDNLICRASKLYLDQFEFKTPLKISVEIEKQIPIGAGLAGGSGNAAATLLALNSFFDNPLPDVMLSNMGKELGADVPFSLKGGLCIGYGRGDILTPLASATEIYFVVAKPKNLSLSTAVTYKAFDSFDFENCNLKAMPDTLKASTMLNNSSIESAVKYFGNAFEPLVFTQHPNLRKLVDHMVDLGALCAHLSGSGPAIYAVVTNKESAEGIVAKLKEQKMDKDIDLFVAKSIDHGAYIESQDK